MNRLITALCLMLPALTLTVQAQQKVPDNQNKLSMESKTIKLTLGDEELDLLMK